MTKTRMELEYKLERIIKEISIDFELNINEIKNIDCGICKEKHINDTKYIESYSCQLNSQLERMMKENELEFLEIIKMLKNIKSRENIRYFYFTSMNTYENVDIFKFKKVKLNDQRYFFNKSLDIVLDMQGTNKLFNFKMTDDISDEINRVFKKVNELEKIDCLKNLSGLKIEEIIFSNGSFGVIVHEAIGHILEEDYFNSIYEGKEIFQIKNKYVIDNLIVKDYSKKAENFFKLQYDDNGNIYKEKVIFQEGKIKNLLQNKMEIIDFSGGNSRRQSYKNDAIARMSTTFIEKGKYSYNEIMNSIENSALEVVNISNAFVNPGTMNISIECSESYIYENKNKKLLLENFIINIDINELLNKIKLIGNDLIFYPGSCIKNNQIINIGIGSPTVKIEGNILNEYGK